MSRRGFTLVEVVVALALGALVVVSAERIVAAITDAAERGQRAREAADRDANARRVLVQVFRSVAIGGREGGPFEGSPEQVRCVGWLPAPTHGFTAKGITLAVRQTQLMLAVGSDDTVALAADVSAVAFDYLLEPGADAHWVRQWVSAVTAPLAVRMRLTRHISRTDAAPVVDTTLLTIGPRG